MTSRSTGVLERQVTKMFVATLRPAWRLISCLALLFAPGTALAEDDNAAAAQPAPAEEEDVYAGPSKRGYNPETAVFGPLPRYRTEDGNINLGGGLILQGDAALYSQSNLDSSEIPRLESGFEARRAILLGSGLFYSDFIAFASYDAFHGGDAVMDGLRSALVAYRGLDPVWFTVGQQGIASPLDAATFSTRRSFMEEAMSSGAFAYAPGTPSLGVAAMRRTKHNFFRGGFFGVPAKEIGGDSEGYGAHGRATWAPIAERDRALHFGVAGYWRKPTVTRGEVGGREQFKARPELRVDDAAVVDTGSIERVENYYFGALEFLTVYDSMAFQAEYHRVEVNRYNGPHDTAYRDLSFDGFYAQASYYLTGESPNYYSRFATLWRVQPFNEFDLDTGGMGAWEVAARFSHIDLDDGVDDLAHGGIRGGVGNNVTLALNWYPTALTKVSVNYVHSEIDNRTNTGLNSGGTIDSVGFRLQFEF
jgi:phosphate-selective porin OprO/OprP